MRKKVSNIGRNININTSDTKINTESINRYLPGGILSIAWDYLSDLIVKVDNDNCLRRWSSIIVGREA